MPVLSTYKVTSPRMFLQADILVQELINEDTTEWKSSVIDALFLPHESDIIKSIPISSRLPPDKLIWTETRNGLFTVRSAYHLARTWSASNSRGTSSDNSTLKRFWKKIWSIPVLHKIQHFAWRACCDALPTKSNLLRRKVIQEDICESCREATETVGHVLWSCPKAKEVWECSKLVIGWNGGTNQTFQDLMWELLINGDAGEDKVAYAVTIAWALWHNRNEVRYGGVRKSGQQISSWASDYLREYRAATVQVAPGVSVARQVIPWSPPQNGQFKINVDGAVFSEQKAVGVGVVIRDDKGRLEA